MIVYAKTLIRRCEITQKFRGLAKRSSLIVALVRKLRAEREVKRAFSNLATHPILVLSYQMGKVGSSTVVRSLKDAKIPNSVLHLHFLSEDLPNHRKTLENAGMIPPPDHIFLGETVRRKLLKSFHWQYKIISLVRDPIAWVVSDLFQNPNFARENVVSDNGTIDPAKACKYLEHELRNPETFRYMNEWFDRELKRVFDIDVFAEPFPVDDGFAVYRKSNVTALVIRMEDLSEKGPHAISEFLGLDKPLILKGSNIRINSVEADSYQKILKNIHLDPLLCEEIYSSRLVKHFYSELMVDQFISKWTEEKS